MAAPLAPTQLSSANWTGADCYDPGDELHTRATTFLEAFDWHQLTALATGLCSNISCHLEPNFAIGHSNMVRQITFDDGVKWAARLRLPPLPSIFGNREALDSARIMEVEIATMKYLRLHTSIPVPEVYAHSTTATEAVDAPYILMSCLPGIAASEMPPHPDSPPGCFGSPEQDRHFLRQMAQIQMQLAALRFPGIGALYESPNGTFTLGPEPVTGKGPWTTLSEYYHDWAEHAHSVAAKDAEPEVQAARSFHLPKLFPPLIKHYGCGDESTGSYNGGSSYGLANRDLGPHNLLVDAHFNITGLIDFDGVMAAPFEVLAQLPELAGLQLEIPGRVETRPAALERIERTKGRVEMYVGMLGEVDGDVDRNVDGVKGYGKVIGEGIMGKAASLVQGLKDYEQLDGEVNGDWMKAWEMMAAEGGVEVPELE